jgi:NTP pyrophosphatase (non-canonical NTP hydrolase)
VEFASGADARAAWELQQPPKPEGVPSELADVVIRALDAADAWGIDLGAVIEEKLAYNATRGHRHGGKTA